MAKGAINNHGLQVAKLEEMAGNMRGVLNYMSTDRLVLYFDFCMDGEFNNSCKVGYIMSPKALAPASSIRLCMSGSDCLTIG